MRLELTTILLLALCLANQRVSADYKGYAVKYFTTLRDPSKTDDQIIKYLIKAPANPTPGAPVFYGTGGRVNVESLVDQYELFDSQIANFDTAINGAIVVFVEQRFFGDSKPGEDITKLDDLSTLTVQNVIQDHVNLIKYLSGTLNTKNFLVFGGGHGGLVAGYLANTFATEPSLSDFKVLAWASSPPLKYLYQAGLPVITDLQQINQRYATLLLQSGCVAADIAKFGTFFRDLKAAPQNVLDGLNLTPKPKIPATSPNDLNELAVFIRNSLLSLSFDNSWFNNDGTLKGDNLPLKRVCNFIHAYVSPITQATQINNLLTIISTQNPLQWKVTDDGTGLRWNRELAAATYQDCTQLQIVSCVKLNDANDPFQGTQWNPAQDCQNFVDYKAAIRAECQGIFGDTNFEPSDHTLDATKYPVSLKTNVIVTMNKLSIFDGSYSKYQNDKNEAGKAWNWELWGVDQWEFQKPRDCDTDLARDIRYLVLRAFGCFAWLVENSADTCKSPLFSDGNYDDTAPPSNVACPADGTNFPWGHYPVTFKKNPLATTANPVPKTSTQPPTTTHDSAGSAVLSVTTVLLSSLFLWFFKSD